MIKIRVFCSFSPPDTDDSEAFIRTSELKDDPEYNTVYCFTNDDDYTHAILLNTPMPELKIPKENVIGLAFEPIQFLGLTPQFVDYAQQHIGKYFIGSKGDLPAPFMEHFAYMWHMTPLTTVKKEKKKLMSIMISNKLQAGGHKYRHVLANKILESNLPIDIYGRGCNYYKTRDKRLKGEFKDQRLMLEDYKYHICIENYISSHYFSEKIMDTLLCNSIPIYMGCVNIDDYFPESAIHLTGDVEKDWELLRDICNYPDKYNRTINIDKVKHTISIKRLIENNFYSTNI